MPVEYHLDLDPMSDSEHHPLAADGEAHATHPQASGELTSAVGAVTMAAVLVLAAGVARRRFAKQRHAASAGVASIGDLSVMPLTLSRRSSGGEAHHTPSVEMAPLRCAAGPWRRLNESE